jgi:hypothetical protein
LAATHQRANGEEDLVLEDTFKDVEFVVQAPIAIRNIVSISDSSGDREVNSQKKKISLTSTG